MSEEVKIKISQPMFEIGELERFDNNIHNIVAEYSKLMFKEKDQILTQRIIMKQEEEIERLHSIIKETSEDLHQVVKWCTENKHNEDTIERYLVVDYGTIVGKINEIRTKLDKGSDKE